MDEGEVTGDIDKSCRSPLWILGKSGGNLAENFWVHSGWASLGQVNILQALFEGLAILLSKFMDRSFRSFRFFELPA